MKKIILMMLAFMSLHYLSAQNNFATIVKDKETAALLSNVTVSIDSSYTVTTDEKGYAELKGLPSEKFIITWSHTGYYTFNDTVILPQTAPMIVLLERDEELEEIVVQSTRTGRTIANTPTRIETIDGEELDEKMNMRPSNVSMLLHESTGIQVQQTSATSGNASIRVQGLDGRYTQLLKDGYPNFGNFANGLSILEIPPLDLKQVEVIKGPASTLYGGGAIAGVINFISKTPEEKFTGDFLINQSNIGQTNIGTYLSQRHKKIGYSFLGQANFQKAYDVDRDGFSELPLNKNFAISPKLYFYPSESFTVVISNNLAISNNTGGDMHVIGGNGDEQHVYFEKNKTLRNTTTVEVDKRFVNNNSLKLKQSLTIFDRDISIPEYNFSGKNINSFSDIAYLFQLEDHTMIAGVNFIYDEFKQQSTNIYNNHSSTAGIYFQDTWDFSDLVKFEAGLRADYTDYSNINFKKSQGFLLPRISALFKWSNSFTSRIGGGLGYKLPTIFTERTESMQYQNIMPLNNVEAEKSIGTTADVNYKTKIGSFFSLSINQMFFYTSINKPLVLEPLSEDSYWFINASKPIISKGFETNLKLIFKEDLKLFAGYTFTDAVATYTSPKEILPLMPRHKINAVIMYEKEDNFKLGLEGYHTGTQFLYNGAKTPSFWEFGFMAQKTFRKLSVFVNFENFTDERQSRYKKVVNPPYNNPVFDDIWNHTEGRIINGGIKLKL